MSSENLFRIHKMDRHWQVKGSCKCAMRTAHKSLEERGWAPGSISPIRGSGKSGKEKSKRVFSSLHWLHLVPKVPTSPGHTTTISVFGRQMMDDLKYEASLVYIARLCLKKINNNNKSTHRKGRLDLWTSQFVRQFYEPNSWRRYFQGVKGKAWVGQTFSPLSVTGWVW